MQTQFVDGLLTNLLHVVSLCVPILFSSKNYHTPVERLRLICVIQLLLLLFIENNSKVLIG